MLKLIINDVSYDVTESYSTTYLNNTTNNPSPIKVTNINLSNTEYDNMEHINNLNLLIGNSVDLSIKNDNDETVLSINGSTFTSINEQVGSNGIKIVTLIFSNQVVNNVEIT